jgi:hypothetical protein
MASLNGYLNMTDDMKGKITANLALEDLKAEVTNTSSSLADMLNSGGLGSLGGFSGATLLGAPQ